MSTLAYELGLTRGISDDQMQQRFMSEPDRHHYGAVDRRFRAAGLSGWQRMARRERALRRRELAETTRPVREVPGRLGATFTIRDHAAARAVKSSRSLERHGLVVRVAGRVGRSFGRAAGL